MKVLIAEHYHTSQVVAVSKDRAKLEEIRAILMTFSPDADPEKLQEGIDAWEREHPEPAKPPIPATPKGMYRKEFENTPEFMVWNESYNDYLRDGASYRRAKGEFTYDLSQKLISEKEWPAQLLPIKHIVEAFDYDYKFVIKETVEL